MKEKTKQLFKAVNTLGGLFREKHITLKAIPSSLHTKERKGDVRVVVSKKVVTSAVSRNTIKRRVKDIIERVAPKLHGVVYVKKGIEELSQKELTEEIVSTIGQLEGKK